MVQESQAIEREEGMLLTKAVGVAQSQETDRIRAWMIRFAAAVRGVDYARGRRMFDEEVVSFGSINEMLEGIDELEMHQWRNVWGATRRFEFDYDSLRCEVRGDMAWALALWSSQGVNADGWYDRHGRCTVVFRHTGDRWPPVHPPFSMAPKPGLREA